MIVNTFKKRLDAHREGNSPDVQVNCMVTQIDVPGLIWTVVVPAWLRAKSNTIRYITTHNIANPLHHTVTQVQLWPPKGDDDSSKHLLAKLGQLSLNTFTHRKN